MEDPNSAKIGDHEKTTPSMGGAAYRDTMKRHSVINMSKVTTMQYASEIVSTVFNVPPQEYRRTSKSDTEIARSFGDSQTPNPYANLEFDEICKLVRGGFNRISLAIAQNDKRERTGEEDVAKARKVAYGALKAVMSQSSHSKCMLKEDYRNNENIRVPGHFNPDVLARVMYEVHVTDQGGSTVADAQDYKTKLEDDWRAVKMLDHEEVHEYVFRYQFARDACITAGGRCMNDIADVMHFVKGLGSRYSGLKLLYSNMSRPWPTTLQAAYGEADQFKDMEPIRAPSKQQPSGQTAAQMARNFAFQVKAQDQTAAGAEKQYTAAQTARFQRRQTVMQLKATALAGQPDGTPFCARCGKTGHGAHDCRTEHGIVDAFDERITKLAGVAKPQSWSGTPADVKKGGRTAKFAQDTKVMVIGKKAGGITRFEAEWTDDENEMSEGEAYDDIISDNAYIGVIRDKGQDQSYSSPEHKPRHDTAAAGMVQQKQGLSSVRGAMSPPRSRAADSVAAAVTAAAVESATAHHTDTSEDEWEWPCQMGRGDDEWEWHTNPMSRGDPSPQVEASLNTPTAVDSATANDSHECTYDSVDDTDDDEWHECTYDSVDDTNDDEWAYHTSQMGRGDPSYSVDRPSNRATAEANDDKHTSHVIMLDHQHTNTEHPATPSYQTHTIPVWGASLVLLAAMFLGVLMPPRGDATRTPRGGVSHAIASGIPGVKIQPWRHIADRLGGTAGIQGALDAL
jgi:hypothetical protein